MALQTVTAAVVEWTQAPPAIVFRQPLQCQTPTTLRLSASLPQNGHVKVACCDTSIFFTVF